jgi:hypothetical protein
MNTVISQERNGVGPKARVEHGTHHFIRVATSYFARTDGSLEWILCQLVQRNGIHAFGKDVFVQAHHQSNGLILEDGVGASFGKVAPAKRPFFLKT